jgi:hypothetical protein
MESFFSVHLFDFYQGTDEGNNYFPTLQTITTYFVEKKKSKKQFISKLLQRVNKLLTLFILISY